MTPNPPTDSGADRTKPGPGRVKPGLFSVLAALWRHRGLGSLPPEDYLGAVEINSWSKQKAVRGSATTIISGGLGVLMQLGSTMVLARLLTPRDVGLVTIVTTFTLLLGNVGLNGFTEAIIQRESITQEQLSTLFWINAAIGFVLTAGFVLAAAPLASVYHEPELKTIAIALAFSIALTALGTLHLALLKRNMEFNILNANSVVSKAVSVVLALVAAWMGYGYWALIVGFLSLPAVTALGAWLYCSWRPSLPARHCGVRPMIQFAIHTLGYFVTNYVGRNLDKVLVGRFCGSALLGNYKRAYDLFLLPIGLIPAPLTTVALAALGPLRGEPEKYCRYYLKSVAVMAFIGMGMGGALTIAGHEIIRVLLGPKWDEAQEVFTWFAPGVGIMLVYYTNAWLHLSLGHADRWFKWGIVEMTVACLFTLAGLPFGPVGVAAAMTCSFLVLVGPGLSYAGQPIGLRFSTILSATWRYAFSALIAAFLCWLPFLLIAPVASLGAAAGPFLRLVLKGGMFLALYMGILALLPFEGTFTPILDVWKMLRPKWLQTNASQNGLP